METILFDIAHCSSFEQNYEPENLLFKNLPSGHEQDPFQKIDHRGWQTKRLPEYPQDLILVFNQGLCRIQKIEILSHHYKIASQIEVYVGTTKEQADDSMYIQFTRLGFVSLDNNNRFQNRELKSIKIQADCEYIRLVIKGCHENRLNTHKQVGILAVHILGQKVGTAVEENTASKDTYIHQEPSQQNMNVDFNLELWIGAVQNAEEEAAQDEDYKEAKIYKELGDRLTGLWRFLTDVENDIMQAVANKNYDEVERIKADMLQSKTTAETLLKQAGIQITKDGDILPYDAIIRSSSYSSSIDEEDSSENAIPEIQSIKDMTTSKLNRSSIHPEQLLDEAIANWTSFDALSINNDNAKKEDDVNSSLLSAKIPINHNETKAKQVYEELSPEEELDPETVPEPLTTEDIELCELAIQQFGEDTVACIMSVKVKCRQYGLNQLLELIEEEKEIISSEKKQYTTDLAFVEAIVLMIQETLTDSREFIFSQAIQVWNDLHDILLPTDKKILGWIEKIFSRVLIRTSDNNPGIKSLAASIVVDYIQKYEHLITLCLQDRMIRNLKDAKSRIDLVITVTKKILVPCWKRDESLYFKHIMAFINAYLKKHPHADVRKAAWNLLVIVAHHQELKNVSTYLESDSLKSLQQELKKSEKKKVIKASNSTTVNELRALAVKSNSPSPTNRKKQQTAPNNQKSSSGTNSLKKTKVKKIQPEEEEEKSNVCIFCEEENQDFNEDTLISHYYNDCPVLTNCPMCQIILEVSTLRDHCKKDCERKHLVKQCTTCREFIPVEQWLQHSLKKACPSTSAQQSRCPFCQEEMTQCSEMDWKLHLVQKCPKNPRLITI